MEQETMRQESQDWHNTALTCVIEQAMRDWRLHGVQKAMVGARGVHGVQQAVVG